MDAKASVRGDIRIARKEYRCTGGPYHVCNRLIPVQEPYFILTIEHPNRFTTHRFCIECGERFHGQLFRQARTVIRSQHKRAVVTSRTSRLRFLKSRAAQFRKKSSSEESFLWDRLKSRKLGTRFEHQVTIHGFIVDFWCAEKQLVVELDGAGHRNRRAQDQQRDRILANHKIEILRFPSRLVFYDIEFILDRIKESLKLS